jgi:hypothetical protein
VDSGQKGIVGGEVCPRGHQDKVFKGSRRMRKTARPVVWEP